MRKLLIFHSFLAAGAPLLTHSAYGAKLIRNGGFEKPAVSAGSYQVYSEGETFTAWKVVGAAGNVAIVSGTFEQDGFTFPAVAGSQWLDLTGNSNTVTGVQQTVPTTAGTAYTLTFYVGNIYDPGGIFGTTSTVNVLVNGTQVYTATNTKGNGLAKQVWQKFTTTITAVSAHTTIAFMNGDPSNDTSNGLDQVSLVVEAADQPAVEQTGSPN
ncbi:MAG TPA: DUF642 domain-containing protein [Bryobacteraceae bacterium]|nr:DUF642 domain-containing protein [Bryobacteraceae bacterium]